MSTPRFTSEHRVGVLMGGLSPETSHLLKSGKAVAESLRSRGYNVIEIIVDRNIATVLEQANIDVAWLALHGTYGEDGCIQGLLEIMQIPYTSSGVQACAVSMHKTSTKRLLQDTNVRCVQRYRVVCRTTVPFWLASPCRHQRPSWRALRLAFGSVTQQKT